MKSNFRIINVAVLLVIYCFAIVASNNSLINADFSGNKFSSQEKIISNSFEKLFCHTKHSETSFNNYNNLPGPGFENKLSGFYAFLKAREQLIESEFSQYTTFAEAVLINQRKSDLIFPFHYFW